MDNRIFSYTIIYSYSVNLNLVLICIELLEIWSFIVNMPKSLGFWSNIFLSVKYFFQNQFLLNM